MFSRVAHNGDDYQTNKGWRPAKILSHRLNRSHQQLAIPRGRQCRDQQHQGREPEVRTPDLLFLMYTRCHSTGCRNSLLLVFFLLALFFFTRCPGYEQLMHTMPGIAALRAYTKDVQSQIE